MIEDKIEIIEEVKPKNKKNLGGYNQNNTVVLTPHWLFDWIEKEFNVKFDFDPCVINAEEKGIDNLTKETEWGMFNYVNPPYTKKKPNVKHFLQKALEEYKKGKTSIFLMPIVSSDYFLDLVWNNFTSFYILPNVVAFNKPDGTYYNQPLIARPMCIVEFNPNKKRRKRLIKSNFKLKDKFGTSFTY